FSSMLLPPPSSTLFPYTTLFRSFRSSSRDYLPDVYLHPIAQHCELVYESDVYCAKRVLEQFCEFCRARRRNRMDAIASHHLAQEDRKSTRLNSSHLVISYAVFCL